VAAYALLPIALLAVLFAVLFMNAAAGALATLATLIVMELLVVFPGVTPYLLTSQLSAYVAPAVDLGWVVALIAFYCAAFAASRSSSSNARTSDVGAASADGARRSGPRRPGWLRGVLPGSGAGASSARQRWRSPSPCR
jgi:hypothetical protein